jgi:hypothetical protein
MPSDFVIPGENRCSAGLDLARTIVRPAERLAVTDAQEGSHVLAYLNRLQISSGPCLAGRRARVARFRGRRPNDLKGENSAQGGGR